MNKIKEWLKEHQSLIIACLLLVIMLKGCSSCQAERQFEYQMTRYEYAIDSMQNIIDERSINTKDLCDTIHSLRAENTVLKNVITEIKADKEYYRKQNKNLAVVAENLSRKDTIN
jgi:septal ring factor EnvC (AmiA/AmiB activator)